MSKPEWTPEEFRAEYAQYQYGLSTKQIDVLAQRVDGRKCEDCGQPITREDVQAMSDACQIGSDLDESPNLRKAERDLRQCWSCYASEFAAQAEVYNTRASEWYDQYADGYEEQQLRAAEQQQHRAGRRR